MRIDPLSIVWIYVRSGLFYVSVGHPASLSRVLVSAEGEVRGVFQGAIRLILRPVRKSRKSIDRFRISPRGGISVIITRRYLAYFSQRGEGPVCYRSPMVKVDRKVRG